MGSVNDRDIGSLKDSLPRGFGWKLAKVTNAIQFLPPPQSSQSKNNHAEKMQKKPEKYF